MLQAIFATGHVFYKPYMLQAIYAYITNYLQHCISFSTVQTTEADFRGQVGFVKKKTTSGKQDCVKLCVCLCLCLCSTGLC